MNYDLKRSIEEGSLEGQNIEALAGSARPTSSVRGILGAFHNPEDANTLTEAVELAMKDRERRNPVI